jgi:xanthine dehydrogenase YagT iron-sulfur-binding subunit
VPTQNDDCSSPLTSLEKLSRRAFLARAGAAGVVTATAAVAVPMASPASAQQQASTSDAAIPGTVPITLRVNGETHKLQIGLSRAEQN